MFDGTIILLYVNSESLALMVVLMVESRELSLFCTCGQNYVPTKSADSEVCGVFSIKGTMLLKRKMMVESFQMSLFKAL